MIRRFIREFGWWRIILLALTANALAAIFRGLGL